MKISGRGNGRNGFRWLFGNDPSIRPGFQKLHSVFHIKSTAPKMQIVQLLKMVEKSCPVGDSISHGVVLDEPELDRSADKKLF